MPKNLGKRQRKQEVRDCCKSAKKAFRNHNRRRDVHPCGQVLDLLSPARLPVYDKEKENDEQMGGRECLYEDVSPSPFVSETKGARK